MRIYIIADQPKDESYFMLFENYALREDIVLINFSSAKSDLETRLLQRQEHVDVLVLDIDQKVDHELEDGIVKWITNSRQELSYSKGNFKFSSIPIVIVYKSYLHLRYGDFQFGISKHVLVLNDKKIGLHNNPLAHAIDSWLTSLSADLDSLDLNVNFNFKAAALDSDSSRINDCSILSTNFLKNRTALNYNWIGDKALVLEAGAEMMSKMIKKYEVSSTYRNEKEIHAVLNNYQGFLLGEKNDRTYYEKHLYYSSSRRYIEVDFVNVGHKYFGEKYELTEVKLPSVRFVSRTGLLLSNTRKHFNQIGKKYKEYFESSIYHETIKSAFESNNNGFNLTLLIGRKQDAEENKYLINQELQHYEKRLNIVTYDDLIDRYNFLFRRIKRFSIN